MNTSENEGLVLRTAVETDGVQIVDVGSDPTPERMAALDDAARCLGGVRRIEPSVYVLWPKRQK